MLEVLLRIIAAFFSIGAVLAVAVLGLSFASSGTAHAGASGVSDAAARSTVLAGAAPTLATQLVRGAGQPVSPGKDALADLSTLAEQSGQDLSVVIKRHAGQDAFEAVAAHLAKEYAGDARAEQGPRGDARGQPPSRLPAGTDGPYLLLLDLAAPAGGKQERPWPALTLGTDSGRRTGCHPSGAGPTTPGRARRIWPGMNVSAAITGPTEGLPHAS